MRPVALLSSATAVFLVLTACSSHWEQRAPLDPVAVDLSTEETRLRATVALERLDPKTDALPCAALTADLRLSWQGPDGVAVDVRFEAGEDPYAWADDGVVLTVDGETLANGGASFAQDGPGRCEVVLTAILTSEDGVSGTLAMEVFAADTSAGSDDDPDGEVSLTADVEIL